MIRVAASDCADNRSEAVCICSAAGAVMKGFTPGAEVDSIAANVVFDFRKKHAEIAYDKLDKQAFFIFNSFSSVSVRSITSPNCISLDANLCDQMIANL